MLQWNRYKKYIQFIDYQPGLRHVRRHFVESFKWRFRIQVTSLWDRKPKIWNCVQYPSLYFRYTELFLFPILSINNPEFEKYLGKIYPAELEIKDTTESTTSASYLDLLLSIGRDGQLHTPIYNKRNDFNFYITNFPFLSSNIPSSPL